MVSCEFLELRSIFNPWRTLEIAKEQEGTLDTSGEASYCRLT